MTRSTLLCAATIVISGCVSTQSPAPVVSGCSAFAIIHPSRQDTLDTKKQVLAHNTVYRKVCGDN